MKVNAKVRDGHTLKAKQGKGKKSERNVIKEQG